MGIRLRWLVILFGAALVVATFTYPLWRPEPSLQVGDEFDFPELDDAQQAQFATLPLRTQRAYLDMREVNVMMAQDLLDAHLSPAEPLPEEAQLPPETDVVAAGEFAPVILDEFSEREVQPFDSIYEASGTVVVYQFPDGRKVLRFEDLQVVNGPDLRVILSANPPPVNREELLLDRLRIDIGPLKSPVGSQNYTTIPVEIDIDNYQSVVIYDNTYGIIFGAAVIN